MSLDDALATLHEFVHYDANPVYDLAPSIEALDCVKTEIARLEAAVGGIGSNSIRNLGAMQRWRERAEDAEAEVARLQQLVAADEAWGARALLAEAEVARLRDGLRDVVDVAIWLTGAGDLTDVPAWPEMREKLNRALALLAEDGAA